MKKHLFIIISLILLLVACGENEYEKDLREAKERLEKSQEDLKRVEEISDQIDKTTESLEALQGEMGIESEYDLDLDELREDLEYSALNEDDVLTDLVVEDGEVLATIEIGDNDIIDDKILLAESLYSSAGDILLEYDGWEVLTIEFVDIGEISLHRDERETNEYGMEYLPLDKIIGQLE